jgi:hypothetical protein
MIIGRMYFKNTSLRYIIFRENDNYNLKYKHMAVNKTVLIALGGAAAAAILYRYLGTEKGKDLLNSASGVLKDLTSKATELAKNSAGLTQATGQSQPV